MHEKKKVLILDNKMETSLWVRGVLKGEDFEVLHCKDGLEGLEKAKKEKPDLVILELFLPSLDGYRVSAFIKRNRNLKGTKILAFSSTVTPESHRLMEEAGIDLFMQKEKDRSIFLEKLNLLFPREVLER